MLLIVRNTAEKALAELGARVEDRRPMLQAMGDAVAQLALRSFNDESVRAARWAPLSPMTVAAKLKAGAMTGILKRHGLLSRSFRVTSVTNDSVTVGSDRPYARYHQTGGKYLPARPMLPLTGTVESPVLTPLAIRNMLSVAKAVLGLN